MGKLTRAIAQKVKVKQHQQTKKAKPVKTNLKRVRAKTRHVRRQRLLSVCL